MHLGVIAQLAKLDLLLAPAGDRLDLERGIDLVMPGTSLEMGLLHSQSATGILGRHRFGDTAAQLAGSALGGGHVPEAVGLLQPHPGAGVADPGRRSRRPHEVERCGPAIFGIAAVCGVAKAKRHRDGLVVETRIRIRGQFHRSGVGNHTDYLAPPDVEPARGLERDLGPRMPGDLGDRVGVLEQPGPVGAATVVEEHVRECHERELTLGRCRRRRERRSRCGWRRWRSAGWRRGRRPIPGSARGKRRPPPGLTTGAGEPGLPEVLLERRGSEPGEAAAQRPGHTQQHIAGVAALEYRLHNRLHEPGHPGTGAQVVPALQRVQIGKQQVGRFGGLVEEGSCGHLEGHLGHLLDEAVALRKCVRRIGVVHHQQTDLAAIHGGHQALHSRQALASGRGLTGKHGAANIAGHAVEDRHCHCERKRIVALRRDAAGDGEARSGAGKLARHCCDSLGRHAADPRRSLRGPFADQ